MTATFSAPKNTLGEQSSSPSTRFSLACQRVVEQYRRCAQEATDGQFWEQMAEETEWTGKMYQYLTDKCGERYAKNSLLPVLCSRGWNNLHDALQTGRYSELSLSVTRNDTRRKF